MQDRCPRRARYAACRAIERQEDPWNESPSTKPQIDDLLYQALETELGGVEVYRMAILCARNEDLKEEWTKYLEQTERHVEIVRDVFDALGLDPEATTPGRAIVRDKGKALVSRDAEGAEGRAAGRADRRGRVRRRRGDEGPPATGS